MFEPDSNLKEIRELKRTLNYVVDNQIFSAPLNDLSMVYANLGQRNAAHGPQAGQESSLPIITEIYESVDTGIKNTIDYVTTNLIPDLAGVGALVVKWVEGVLNDGAKLFLEPPFGKTLQIQPGGDFAVSSPITLTDQDKAIAIYSRETGKFKVITGNAGSGGTTLWSAITIDINKDMLGFALYNLGTISFHTTSGLSPEINASTDSRVLNTYVNGFNAAKISQSNTAGFQGTGVFEIFGQPLAGYNDINPVASVKTVAQDTTPSPGQVIGEYAFDGFSSILTRRTYSKILSKSDVVTNGSESGKMEFWNRRAGSDTLIATMDSGFNVLTNLTVSLTSFLLGDVGLGSSGSNNIAFNGRAITSLIPNTDDARDLGTALLRWATAYLARVQTTNVLFETGGTITATLANIINDGSHGLRLNVAAARNYDFRFGNSSQWTMSSSTFSGNNIILNQSFTLNDSGINPSFNGEFRRNGVNLRVFTGGTLKDLTQMPQLNTTNTWTSGNLFNAGLSIPVLNFIILDNNDTSSSYIRQSSAVGIAPRVVDIAAWGDIAFKAVGASVSAQSRGLVRGMIKAGAPTTVEIPASYFTVVKNTSDGSTRLYYNDAGTLRSVALT